MPKPEKPRKLQDKTKQEKVITALELGCSLTAAAKLANCSPNTVRRETRLDPDFGERYEKARGQSEFDYLDLLHSAAKKPQYWRAAAWALERRFPKHYAPRSPDVITLSQITILIAKIAQILEEEIPVARLRKNILKRLDAITSDLRREQQPDVQAITHQPEAQARTETQPPQNES